MASNVINLESPASSQQVIEAEAIQRKISRSTKPLQVKMAVVTARALGQSKMKIAKDLGITDRTVTAILKEQNYEGLVAGAKYGMNTLAFDSVEAIAHHVGKKNLKAAMYVLDKTVFVEEASGKTFQQNLQVNVHIPRPDSKQFEQPIIEAKAVEIPAESTAKQPSTKL